MIGNHDYYRGRIVGYRSRCQARDHFIERLQIMIGFSAEGAVFVLGLIE